MGSPLDRALGPLFLAGIQAYLGSAWRSCAALHEPGVRKGPHSVSLTGPPASVKREEESSGGESPTSPPRDSLPGMGPGE